jgi:hypothetical protein
MRNRFQELNSKDCQQGKTGRKIPISKHKSSQNHQIWRFGAFVSLVQAFVWGRWWRRMCFLREST